MFIGLPRKERKDQLERVPPLPPHRLATRPPPPSRPLSQLPPAPRATTPKDNSGKLLHSLSKALVICKI